MPARSTDAAGRDRWGKSTPAALDAATLDPASIDALVHWYARTGRDLPWRRTRDPYRILVSEIMLQQTRVEAVVGRFERFLVRFPSLRALAGAKPQEVLAEWSGLGYYRRARNLHRLAQQVLQQHGGRLPADPDALRALPGLGEYTAAAVSSIVFDLPCLAIDGNVARVLCRLLALDVDPRRVATKRHLHRAAAPALQRHSPGQLNQALMELGARVCLPRSPRCESCPCASACLARQQGIQEHIPPPRRQAIRDVQEAAMVLEREGRYLLFRGQRPGVLESMWEFPTLDSRLMTTSRAVDPQRPTPSGAARTSGTRELAEALQRHLSALHIETEHLELLGAIRHGITNRRILCHVFRPRIARFPSQLRIGSRTRDAGWYTPAEIRNLPLAASARKITDLLADPPASAGAGEAGKATGRPDLRPPPPEATL